jgi:hypothetical protein
MARVFTPDDPYHLHALLGASVLFSFVYNYYGALVAGRWHVGGWIMVLHTLLSLSSFFFRVPQKRVVRAPTTIYQEYRAHALVFTVRSLGVWILNTWTPRHSVLRLLLVLATSGCADWVSGWLGTPGNTTVRGDSTKAKRDWRVRLIIPWYSVYQVVAAASHVHPRCVHPFFGFNSLAAIQVSAFCMTLHRKGKIRWYTHAVVYSLTLLLSLTVVWMYTRHMLIDFWVPTLGVVLGRVWLGKSKYILWLLFYAYAMGFEVVQFRI